MVFVFGVGEIVFIFLCGYIRCVVVDVVFGVGVFDNSLCFNVYIFMKKQRFVDWDVVKRYKEIGSIYEGRVEGFNNGGLFVRFYLFVGFFFFSQLSLLYFCKGILLFLLCMEDFVRENFLLDICFLNFLFIFVMSYDNIIVQ